MGRQHKASAAAPLAPGQLVAGRYRIDRELGRGGMGAVFAVDDRTTGRRVALKTLIPKDRSRGAAVHFRREYQTLVRLRHPRVVEAYDFGIDGELLYYTMELLEGEDLRVRPGADLVVTGAIVRDVASALAMLHARRLLHRDLSTRNIRCGPDGHAKLIDFGLLSTMGPNTEIGGTAPYIAPEALYGLPLDQRADLFGLGAVFYALLTGTHAYPAKRLADRVEMLEAGTVPRPPSQFDPRVSPAMDELVLAMVSNDRQARPNSAADVIDRLAALVDLPAAPELDIARGYVRSAVLVGRERELTALRARLGHAAKGHGSAVLLRGRSGAGKSRLLQELVIDARLLDVVAVHTRADPRARGPFAALRRLVQELSRVIPDLVEATIRPRAARLADAFPWLARTSAAPDLSTGDLRERRLQLHKDVTDWLVALARRQPLALMLDDVQRCDESSAAVLLALAQRLASCPLLLVATRRTDEEPAAPTVIDALERVAESIAIGGLESEDLEALVRGSFGDVPNAARLAAFLREHTGGSPMLVIDLLYSLVDRGLIAYADGMWTIASDIAATELPRTLGASLDARIDALAPAARRMAELLAVYGGAASLMTCVALAHDRDEAEVFETLDLLVEDEILVGGRDTYGFRHDGLREALVRNMDPARARTLHQRIGHALLEQSNAGERDAEIGWHLVHGGEPAAGAPLLERAGRELFGKTAFRDAIATLTTTLDVYRHGDLHRDRWPELHYMVSLAGFFADRDVANRFVGYTLELLAEHAGIERIRRTQRVLGPRGGFLAAMSTKALEYRMTPPSRRVLRPRDAIRMFARTSILASSLALAQTERSRLLKILDMMEPLSQIRIGNLDRVYQFLTMIAGMSFGRFGEVRRTGERLLADEAQRLATSDASAMELRLFHGAVRFVYGLALSHAGGERSLDNIEALENLDLQLWRLSAQQLRASHHLRRGESHAAQRLTTQLELSYAQLGSVWQLELGLAPGTAMGRALIDDVLGLRRSVEQLQRLVDTGVDYTGALELARADYHRTRGEYDRALAAIERGLAFFPEVGGFGFGWGLVARVHCLLDARRIDEADAAVGPAREYFADPMHRDDGLYFRFGRVTALLEATQGDLDAAARRLDALLAEAQPLENPAYCGLLHEARAEVAQKADDAATGGRHARAAEAWFRGTDNPVLIARVAKLARTASGPTRVADAPTSVDSDLPTMRTDARAPAAAALDHEATDAALARLVEVTGARDGLLYLVGPAGPSLVAPRGAVAADGVTEMIGRAQTHGVGWQETHRGPEGSFRAVVLRADQSLGTRPVAIAALRAGRGPMHPPATADISEIAEALSPGSASSELSWLRKRRSDPPTQPGTEASAHDPAAVTRNVTGPALPDDTE